MSGFRCTAAVLLLSACLLTACAIYPFGAPPPRCNEVRLGDVDGDGDLDALLGNGPGNIDYAGATNAIALNDGAGRFSDAGVRLKQPDAAFDVTRSVALGDVDGDGDLDLFVGNAAMSASTLWLNDGTGQWSLHGQYRMTPVVERAYSQSETVILADLDGDGDLDIYVGNCCRSGWMSSMSGAVTGSGYADSYNVVWWNDGAGRFADSGQRLGNWATGAAALGDVDGDGDLDAFEVNRGGGRRPAADDPRDSRDMVWLNDGTGRFADSGQRLGASEGHAVALGDLDGDGDLDAYVGNAYVGPEDQVWLNDGTGRYSDSGQRLGSADTRVVVLDDVDGDGDLDAFVGSKQGGQIWVNDGAGLFEGGSHWEWKQTLASTLGDVDGDGDGDSDVLAIRPNGRARVWRNDGAGHFSEGRGKR